MHKHARIAAPSSTRVSFGNLLQLYRTRAHLTQRGLAEKALLSEHADRTVSDLERGINKRPQAYTFQALANALGLNLAERTLLERAAKHGFINAVEVRALEHAAGLLLPPLLAGRAKELAVLKCHLAGEGPPLLVFAGEQGIGKSRLRQEAAHMAAAGGWQIVEGSCTRLGGQQAYVPFASMVATLLDGLPDALRRERLERYPWLSWLALEPFPAIAPAGLAQASSAEQERQRLFTAVGRLLADTAESAGTLLALENLQWVGGDALSLLDGLIRQTTKLPLRFVATYRDTSVARTDPFAVWLADLEQEGLARRVELDLLSLDESVALLQTLLPAQVTAGVDSRTHHAWTQHVARRCGGLPLFLVSYAQELVTLGCVVPTPMIPRTVADSIRQRVATLSPTAQTLLSVASVALGAVSPAFLLSVASDLGIEEDALLAALESAHHERLLGVTATGEYQFSHDLMREVVEGDIGPAHRIVLHRRIAEAIKRLPQAQQSAVELAWHLSEAGEEARALPYLLQAGDQGVRIYAFAEAERHYRQALELARHVGDQASLAETRMRLAQLFLSLARYDDALTHVEQAAAIYRARDDRTALEWATGQTVLIQAFSGTLEQADGYPQRILESLNTRDVLPHVADVYSAIFYHYYATGRHREVVPLLARQITALAPTANPDRSLLQVLDRAGYALLFTGSSADALHAAVKVIPLCEAIGELTVLCQVLHLASLVHTYSGHFAAGRQYMQQAAAIVERTDDPSGPAFISSACAHAAFFRGEWDEARSGAKRSVELGRQTDSSHGLALRALVYPLIESGRMHLVGGAIGPARDALHEAIGAVQHPHELPALLMANGLLAECDIAEGNAAAARDRLRPVIESFALVEWGVTIALPTLAEAQVELREWAEAEDLLTRGVACARDKDERVTLVDLLRVRAMLRSHQGRLPEAADMLEESLMLCRAMPYPYAEAKALYVYGQLHAARGEAELARERFEAAIALCDRLGERLYRQRIERGQADLGSCEVGHTR